MLMLLDWSPLFSEGASTTVVLPQPVAQSMATYIAEHASAYIDVATASGNRVIVFTRVRVATESVPDAAPDVLIAGVGIGTRADPQRYRDLRLSLAQAMTLFFVPAIGTLRALTEDFVQPNDTTIINDVLLTVRDVGPLIALDGLVVAGTIVLSACVMSAFSNALDRFGADAEQRVLDTITFAREEVERSVREGSELTGAPGQPVDTSNLRNSWAWVRESFLVDVLQTNVEYAPFIEDGGNDLAAFTLRSEVGGFHSVKLTISAWDDIVNFARRNATGGVL